MPVARSREVHSPSASPEYRPSLAGLLRGRYEILGELGRGGCAIVYDVRDVRIGRSFAFKVLRPDIVEAAAFARLAREARAAAAIHHPNVAALVDAGTLEDGRPYLVMERLHGETLTSLVQRVGPLGHEDTIDLALQLLSALDASHQASVVHRDVKPDNVFLVPRSGCTPLVKLLDFGMCRRKATTTRDDATLTRAGQVVGTPEYMAPEQVSGKRDFDARIDLYAVGVILYECLSGQRAFFGDDVRAVVLSVLKKPLPALRRVRPDVPRLLERIVSRAMERERSFRYRSASEFQADLLEARDAVSVLRVRESMKLAVQRARADHDEWELPTRQLLPRASVAGIR